MRIRRSLSIALLAVFMTVFIMPSALGVEDMTPPVFLSSVPVDEDLGFTPGPITVTFSEDIFAGPNFDSISLVNLAGEEPTAFEPPTVDGTELTFGTVCPFYWDVDYVLTVPAGAVVDAAGNELASDVVVHFKTRPYTELKLVSFTADPPSRQLAGTPVVFAVEAEYDISESPVYRFRVMQGRCVLYTRDWSPDSTFTWTPARPGAFKVVGEVVLEGYDNGFDATMNYRVTKK